MTKPNPIHLEAACRLLALQRNSASAAYQRLYVSLGPLIGTTSVRFIFARSVKLTALQIVSLQDLLTTKDYAADAAQALDAWQRRSDNLSDFGATAQVFSTFISLLTSFIGERLTTQVMETMWKPSEENET